MASLTVEDSAKEIGELVLDCIESLDSEPERSGVVTLVPGRYDLEMLIRRTPPKDD